MQILQDLTLVLMAWSLFWIGPGFIALAQLPRDFWRGFWVMSGLWAWIDALIALWGMANDPPTTEKLQTILQINAGLDVGYIVIALLLMRKTSSYLKGFGWAILIQGIFLLVLDLYFASRCSAFLAQ